MEEAKAQVKDRMALMHYVDLLRYGPLQCRGKGYVHMTYQQIAKLVGCSTTHVA